MSNTQQPTIEALDPLVHVARMGASSRAVWQCLTLFGAGSTELFRAAAEACRDAKQEEGFLFLIGLARLERNKAAFDSASAGYAAASGKPTPEWDVTPEPTGQTVIAVGENLSSANANFAGQCLSAPAGLMARHEKREMVFDLARTRRASLADARHVIGFIHLFAAEHVAVRLVNVNEILGVLLRVFGVSASLEGASQPRAQ